MPTANYKKSNELLEETAKTFDLFEKRLGAFLKSNFLSHANWWSLFRTNNTGCRTQFNKSVWMIY